MIAITTPQTLTDTCRLRQKGPMQTTEHDVHCRMARRPARHTAGWILGVAWASTLGLLSACGGSGGSTTAPPDPPVSPAVAGLRCSGAHHTGWCWQLPQPWSPVIQDVVFTDARNGWAVGDALLHTTDAGASWAERTLPAAAPLRAIGFLSASDGWLLGQRDGRLWRTRDAGQTWTAAPPAPMDQATGMALLGTGSLLVNGLRDGQGGAPFTLLSDDAAASWRVSARFVYPEFAEADGTLWGLDGGSFAESRDGGRSFAVPTAWDSPYWQPVLTGTGRVTAWQSVFDPPTGGYGKRGLLRPAAGGSWSPVVLPPLADTDGLMGLALFADGGWARSGSGDASGSPLWHRETGTATWTAVVPPGASGLFNHGFVDGRTGWIQPEDQALVITTDGGRSWLDAVSPSADAADPLQFLRRDGAGALLAGYGGDGYLNGARRWYRSTDEGRSWQALPGTGRHGDRITGLWWLDGSHGLAATSGGRWLDTADAGRTWTARADASRLPGSLHDLQFTPNGTGWVVARALQPRMRLAPEPPPVGPVYRTLDQGRTWTAIALPPAADARVTALQFVDDRHGFLLAFTQCSSIRIPRCFERMYATRDAGASWQEAGPERADDGLLHMQSALRGIRLSPWSLYVGRRLLATADGGVTWTDGPELPIGFVPRRLFARGDRLWLLGESAPDGQGLLLSSVDGGRSATLQSLALPADVGTAGLTWEPALHDIAFVDDRHGWIVGRQGLVLATTDGGATWLRQATGSRQDLHTLRATGPQTVWVGGTSTSILATASGGR